MNITQNRSYAKLSKRQPRELRNAFPTLFAESKFLSLGMPILFIKRLDNDRTSDRKWSSGESWIIITP